jgi:hypothetical protein
MNSNWRRFSWFAVVTLALPLVLTSCSRKNEVPNDAGTDAAPPVATSAFMVPAPIPKADSTVQADPEDVSVPPAEPLRKSVSKVDDDAVLTKQRDAILAFFKDDVPSPLKAQFETLPSSRMAIFIDGKNNQSSPFVMVIDANGTRAWTKEMPLAGIVPGVRDIALVRGTESAVGVAFCDSTGMRAALRMWNGDGSINADFEVMEVPHCDRINAVFIPGTGHIIGSVGETTARIGMIAANGMRVWDAAGLALPWDAQHDTALVFGVDSNASFIVVGIAAKTEDKRQPNEGTIMAMRYDFQGRSLWPVPRAIAPRTSKTFERPTIQVVGTQKLEVTISDKPGDRVQLSSEGVIVPLK